MDISACVFFFTTVFCLSVVYLNIVCIFDMMASDDEYDTYTNTKWERMNSGVMVENWREQQQKKSNTPVQIERGGKY